MSAYEVRIIEYTSKRQQRFAVRMTNPVTKNVIQEPGFKTREAAQEWADSTQRTGNVHLELQH